MMRFVAVTAVLLFTRLSGYAQPAVTNLSTDNISHSSARIQWQSSPASNRQVAFDTAGYWDANQAYRYRTSRQNDYRTKQFANITGLEPGTEYAACPLACDSSNSCRTCNPSDPQVRFTTLPEPAVHPRVPALPDFSGFDMDYPPTVSATLNVAADCSNLQTQLTVAASAAYSNQTVEVVIPAGTTCDPGSGNKYTLQPKTGSGWVIVRSAGTLPPEGTRLNPATGGAQLATIRAHATSGGSLDFTSNTAHHYRFVGIRFSTVSLANANDVITPLSDTLLALTNAVNHDIVFDRCHFHGPGYPDRIKYGIVVNGGVYNLAVLNSYMDNIDVWRAYQSGITVTHTSAAKNSYTAGTAHLGNAAVSVGAFSVELSGSGTGHFRIYIARDASVHFIHDVASGLSAACAGCVSGYSASLAVPSDAFQIINRDYGGAETTITNAEFRTAGGEATGGPWTVQGAAEIGIYEGSVGFLASGVHKIKVHNTHINVTGIGFFIEEYADDVHEESDIASDIELTQNSFVSNTDLFAHVAGDTDRVGYRRHHTEFKQGVRLDIEGNYFTDAWLSVYNVSSPAVYIANRANGITEWAETRDITIKNNLITKHPNCLHIAGMEGGEGHSRLTRNVVIENNVCQASAWDRSAYDIAANPAQGSMAGFSMTLVHGGEDYTIRHNTFYDVRGYQPSLLWLTDLGRIEGLVVRDNILSFHNDNNAGGIRMYLDSDARNASPAFTDSRGTTALDQGARRLGSTYPGSANWVFDHNVIVAGCNDSKNCTESTSTNLVDIGVQSALYPAGNYWPTGGTFGERVAAVGFRDAAAGDFRLYDGSPYKGGGGLSASDNRDVGAQHDELESSLGVVKNVTVADVGTRAALLQYTAPDGKACSVEYGVSAEWGSGLRISDGGGVRQRQVVLGDLTPGTHYFYRIYCAAQQPSGEFLTVAGSGGPTNLPIRMKPAQGRAIAEALVEYGSSKALGSTTPPVECAGGCTVQVPAVSGQEIYHRAVYRDAGQVEVAKGSVEASIAH